MSKIIWFVILLLVLVIVYNAFIPKSDIPNQTSNVEAVASYKVLGDLTIRDKTNPIEFELNKTEDGKYVGSAAVDRTLYDVKFGSTKFFAGLGDGVVDDIFVVNFNLVLSEGEITEGANAIDINQSSLTWEGRKTLIASYIDSGSVKLKSGSIVFDAAGNPISGEAEIDMSSILALNTGRGGEVQTTTTLTKHLSSDDFFNVELFPTSKIVIKSIAPVTEEAETVE